MRVTMAAVVAFSIFVATPAAAWPIVNLGLGGRGDIEKVGHKYKYKWEGGGRNSNFLSLGPIIGVYGPD